MQTRFLLQALCIVLTLDLFLLVPQGVHCTVWLQTKIKFASISHVVSFLLFLNRILFAFVPFSGFIVETSTSSLHNPDFEPCGFMRSCTQRIWPTNWTSLTLECWYAMAPPTRQCVKVAQIEQFTTIDFKISAAELYIRFMLLLILLIRALAQRM